MKFEPAIEACYERDTGRGRTARQIACNLIGFGAFWMLTGTDEVLIPAIAGQLRWLHATLLLVLTLGILALVTMWRRSVGGWPREAITSVGTLLIAGYSIFVGHHIGDDTALVMRLSGLVPIFLHAGVAARLRFPFALAVNLAVFVAYAVFAGADNPDARHVFHNHLLLFSCTVVFCSVGNYLLEHRERRGYLLRRLEAERDRAIRADAEALRHAAVRDGLTRIYNRRHFDAELARHWEAALRRGGALCVLQVDVDHFKAYNDRYGHPAGDRCLVQVAETLDAVATAAGGIAARVGGEEFALLLPVLRSGDPPGAADSLPDAALVDLATCVCERIRALALPHTGSTCAPHVTVSVGAAQVVASADLAPSDCIAAADAALYTAKAQGRDRAVRFEGRSPNARAWPEAPGDPASTAPSTQATVLAVQRPLETGRAPDVPGVSVGARPSRDDLAHPGYATDGNQPTVRATAADPQEALIEAFSAQLRKCWIGLRFSRGLEEEFQSAGDALRRRTLVLFLLPCLGLVVAYVWLCAPLLGAIAGLLFGRITVLCAAIAGAIFVVMRQPRGWRWREGVVSAFITAVGLCVVGTEALGTLPTVYTATVGVCLIPMFGSLVAAQPFVFCVVPSLLICLGVATVMDPGPGERHAIWLHTLQVICTSTLYSLVGGFLLEGSRRRTFLLQRLRAAQLPLLQRNTEQFRRLARLDPLTGLPNRRHFDAELDRLAAEGIAARQPLALLIVDIDYFKRYDDAHGHPAGDECLCRVGNALADWAAGGVGHGPAVAAARSPLVARLGGEEFGVLLPGCDGAAALVTADAVCGLLAGLGIGHARSPVAPVVTASVGAASRLLMRPSEARQLFAAADEALYRAKAGGRNQAAA